LLKLGGATLSQPLPVDGRDIWPVLAEGKPSPHESILLNTTPFNGAVRMGDWKLVLNGRRGGGGAETVAVEGSESESVELFHLIDDLSERTNLASEHPGKVKELRGRLDVFAREAVTPKSAPMAPGFKAPKVWGEAEGR
jgi:hypothetical protein